MADKDIGVEKVFTKPTASIKTAFEACFIEADIREQAVAEDGNPEWLEPRSKLGETNRRPRLVANTLRHTISTELHRMGVPEAQIDAAAGHAGVGANKRNYRHLRPGYLAEFIEGDRSVLARGGAAHHSPFAIPMRSQNVE